MKILNFIENKIIVPIAVSLFMFSCIWMLIEAISRRFFNTSYNFSEELVIYSLIWAIFLTLGIGGKKQVHITVDLLTTKMGVQSQKMTKIFNSLIGIVYSFFIIIVSISYIKHLFNTGITSHSSLQIPLYLVVSVVPIGMFFLALFYVDEIKNALKHKSPQKQHLEIEKTDHIIVPLTTDYKEVK